jgi:hypothetical protein
MAIYLSPDALHVGIVAPLPETALRRRALGRRMPNPIFIGYVSFRLEPS